MPGELHTLFGFSYSCYICTNKFRNHYASFVTREYNKHEDLQKLSKNLSERVLDYITQRQVKQVNSKEVLTIGRRIDASKRKFSRVLPPVNTDESVYKSHDAITYSFALACLDNW